MISINLSDSNTLNIYNFNEPNIAFTGVQLLPFNFGWYSTAQGNVINDLNYNEIGTGLNSIINLGLTSLSIKNVHSIGNLNLTSNTIQTLTFSDLKQIIGGINSNIALPVSLTQLSLPELETLSANLVNLPPNLTSLELPKLKHAYTLGNATGTTWNNLTSISLPELISVDKLIVDKNIPILLPKLKYANALFLRQLSGNVIFPELQACSSFGITPNFCFGASRLINANSLSFPKLLTANISLESSNANTTLTQINLPSLKQTDIRISFLNALTTLNLSSVEEIKYTSINNNSNLNYIDLSSLRKIGGQVNLNNNALSQAGVDHILVKLASLDGTNNTTLFGGFGTSVNLTGGTNASPSQVGLNAKSILVARGTPVTHN